MLEIDVVVRTLADEFRSKMLFRALDSIQDQSGIRARPIVIVNGQRFDGATLEALKSRPGILFHQEQEASAGRALAAGRRLVNAPYFSFLDDDDELIADSLLKPVRWLEDNPVCDVLINNGFYAKEGGVLMESTHLADHVNNPALSLMKEAWLSPGACVFRTERIPLAMMNKNWSHLEWTRIAFELCAERKRLHFMDVPTVIYHELPGSMSKQMEHREAPLSWLNLIRRDDRVESEVRREADRKYLRTHHSLAMEYWALGRYGRAWRCHLVSLRPPLTLKYLLFSRKLLWPSKFSRSSESS